MTPELKSYITQALDGHANDTRFDSVSGGSINQAFRVTTAGKSFFCKINSANNYPGLFAKEASGLRTLRHAGAIKAPAVEGVHEHDGCQILLLEWIEGGLRTEEFWKSFGKELGGQVGKHAIESSENLVLLLLVSIRGGQARIAELLAGME